MKRLLRLSIVVTSLLGTVAFAVAQQVRTPAQTERVDFGRVEYRARCATCHGLKGKGDGSMAARLTRKPSDLTTLAKNNNGILPVTAMYSVITGDTELPGAWYTRDAGLGKCITASRQVNTVPKAPVMSKAMSEPGH